MAKKCGLWIVDSAFQLGRASELVSTNPESSKSLASLAKHLLLKEVQKCFDTKKARKLISQGIKYVDANKSTKAYNSFSQANFLIEKGAKTICNK